MYMYVYARIHTHTHKHLPIRQQADVVTIEGALHKVFDLIEDSFLRRVLSTHTRTRTRTHAPLGPNVYVRKCIHIVLSEDGVKYIPYCVSSLEGTTDTHTHTHTHTHTYSCYIYTYTYIHTQIHTHIGALQLNQSNLT